MASPEMIAMLQKRKQDLLKELQAIDVLLAGDKSPNPNLQANAHPSPYKGRLGYVSTRDEHVGLLREKTEAISWKDYTFKALQIVGAARSKTIADLMIDANDHRIPDSRIKDSVTNALTALVNEKKVTFEMDSKNRRVFSII